MNDRRYYSDIDVAEEQEFELLKERLQGNGTEKESSYLYENRETSRVVATDEQSGVLITIAGHEDSRNNGNFRLTKGMAVESLRRKD